MRWNSKTISMELLFQLNDQLLGLTSTDFVRSIMDDIPWDERLVSIRGSRGVGKTTLLLQYQKLHYGINNRKALYVSLEGAYFTRNSLVDFARQCYLQGGERLFLDEVHNYPNWSREIKEIYDFYPMLKIVFTGSSLLQILNADADLSRRCLNYTMQGLSFREYLKFYHDIDVPRYSLQEILSDNASICSAIFRQFRPMEFFNDYLTQGYYPFRKESPERYPMKVENLVDVILNIELPKLCGVDISKVRNLKALLVVMASNVPMLVDVSKLSTMIGLSRMSTLAYLQYLHRAALIRLLYSDDLSVKKLQKPDKILLENSNLLQVLSLEKPNLGTMRETFFCNQLGYKHQIEYTRQGDFLIDHKLTLEIGGKSKDGKQVAQTENSYIAADDMEFPVGNKLPLWLFGLMY